MHLAKGLEFRAVAVMACDDEVIPLQERIETVGDDADLQEVYDTERHLLYVDCTRARDHLLVTSMEPASEFLDDMRQDKRATLLKGRARADAICEGTGIHVGSVSDAVRLARLHAILAVVLSFRGRGRCIGREGPAGSQMLHLLRTYGREAGRWSNGGTV